MKFTEAQLQEYASPISQYEDQKCKNAIYMVRDAMRLIGYSDGGKGIRSFEANTFSYAIDMSANYGTKQITLLVQGSYANKTNIPSQSDVDVAVILESTFTPIYRAGVSGVNYGFSDGTFTAEELKDEVQRALMMKFNSQGVKRHDKCIKVIGNANRVDADVVPAYRYRNYLNDYDNNPENYVGGIEIRPDSGGSIINYPEQHMKNGIEKNKVTNSNFKRCVRIIKNLKELMEEKRIHVSSVVTSFGLESLLWNGDNATYIKYPSVLRYTFDEVIKFLKSNFADYNKYKEANGIKSLFPYDGGASITAYQQFITNLLSFFEYDI